ncbi:cobyric acid synthase [Cytobacillus sp. NCCP-133]|uniref:cobyric acid synthase n=1 Tax=Cytobacillus sp. NCCP-133 TaxID=766848 RepID=UPI002230EFE2|nr:cobyric acid synthase [Cytobacillus sp. NCCP-133]GLB60951.1 cobyric acid synthase CobQ [Cytobacillus sp. NCCP-133]
MQGIMIQGTSSDVGKSLIATAFCRAFSNEGLRAAPFKSQNMSNNSYVTKDGCEIGRAQGIQAEAARADASVWMNPILLKPQSEQHAEVILLGKAIDSLSGKSYRETFYEKGLKTIEEALQLLEAHFELLVIEGAGSPVEINLKDRELVNMKVAEMADVPVILVADIDRGGVFASIIGTLELFTEEERKRVAGIIINKFRGDIGLFEDGVKWIEEKTGIPVLGILPYLNDHMIDGEDSLSIQPFARKTGDGILDIAVLRPPYISNFSDIDPFYYEEDVSIRWVRHLSEIGTPDAVVIPGTKSTIHDLRYFKEKGLADWLVWYAEEGGYITGICGGYQMLGRNLIDMAGTDTGSPVEKEKGLNLIPADTYFHEKKKTLQVKGRLHPSIELGMRESLDGYEIHLGETLLENECSGKRLLLLENGEEEGFYGREGKLIGTYMHHIFHNDEWRGGWLNSLRKQKGYPCKDPVPIKALKDEKYNELAEHLQKHFDWEKLKEIIFNWRKQNEMA